MVKTKKRTETKSAVYTRTRIIKGNSKNNKPKWLESNNIEWSSRNGTCNNQNVESLNEILRFHRNRRALGRRVWKVVPKDSLEVYREKRRRQLETDDDGSNENETQSNESQKRPRRERPQTKCRRKRFKRDKRRRRSSAREPCPLCHHKSCSSSSTSNDSEMDY